MSIKDNIKEELLKMILEEEKSCDRREKINAEVQECNYDVIVERRFLKALKEFAESI